MAANSTVPGPVDVSALQPVVAAPISSGGKVGENSATAGENLLQNVLPEIRELARKVGGYKRLAEIAQSLHEGEK